MTIRELLEMLENVDEEDLDCQVVFASQPNWPFENSISAAYFRRDVTEAMLYSMEPDVAAEMEEGERDPKYMEEVEAKRQSFKSGMLDRWGKDPYYFPGGELILVEGHQMRYGDKQVWEMR